jgi:hypothetical protein
MSSPEPQTSQYETVRKRKEFLSPLSRLLHELKAVDYSGESIKESPMITVTYPGMDQRLFRIIVGKPWADMY